MFIERLGAAARRNASLLCVGLDPDPARFPVGVARDAEGALRFSLAIVEATTDLVCAYKPNLAFWEAFGPPGLEALHRLRHAIPPDIPVIADAKRGDIGNTAEAGAAALFDYYGFDAATVNPYLGADSIEPWLRRPDRAALAVCKTSNPGSGDLQDLLTAPRDGGEQRPLYELVARLVVRLNRNGNCGLVVGATYPEQLAAVRAIAPELPILVPGVGAQGGDLAASVRLGADARGERVIINASRTILYASGGRDFAAAARAAAAELRDAINVNRPTTTPERR